MKNFLYPAIISIFLAGCATSRTVEKNSNADVVNNPAANQTIVNQVTVSQTNREVEAQSKSNAGMTQLLPNRLENPTNGTKKNNPNANVTPIKAQPTINYAPDNSELSIAMSKENVPVETRTFKNNVRLVKVERIFVDAKNPQTKVYLKGGKVVDLPPGKLENAATASASEILNAIGIISNAAPVKK